MPSADLGAMARTWGLIYAFGGTVDLLLLPLPHAEDRYALGVAAPGVLAVCVAIVILVGRRRLPAGFYWALSPLAVLLVSTGVYSVGAGAMAAIAMFYFWILLPTFYFFPRYWGVLNVGLAGIVYAVLLALSDGTEREFKWAMMMATMVVGGALLSWLRGRSERAGTEREELLARVEAMARTDELTGLPNRRAWDEEFRRELALAERQEDSMAVALVDLDQFKDFNDQHGHPAGDALLREVAISWRTTLRATDVIARYGGEEFAVLLPHGPRPDALEAVERLRAATPAGQTCSAGIAYWNGTESGEELVARADAALYTAKAGGRDQTIVAGPAAAGSGAPA